MLRNHANFLRAYTDTLTPKGEAPERFHFWTGVAAIGGALRRRVYIDEGHYRYYPNFYVMLVGPPGLIKKSTTINVGSGLLRDVPNVKIGADVSTWQSFVEEVAQAQDLFAEGEVSVDPLDQTHTVSSALTLTISEFGTFFDPDDRAMVNVLTELYDGKVNSAFVKRTKTQGTDTIMNPFVNILAGTTPDWIRDNFKGRFGGWGLSSRIIFLHCDEKERHVAFPHKLWRGSYDRTMRGFLEDLVAISQLRGVFTLTDAAETFYEHWYESHGERQTALNRHDHHDPWLAYYLARKADHVLKLSMVLSVSRSDTLIIDADDIATAVSRCDEIELELSKVFHSSRTETREGKLNQDVWDGIANGIKLSGGAIEEDRFFAFTIMFMAGGKARELLNHLLAAKWLVRSQEGGRVWLSFGPHAKLKEEPQNDSDADTADITDANSDSGVQGTVISLQQGTRTS